MTLPALEKCTIAVIGLGYVGLPLLVEFTERVAVAIYICQSVSELVKAK